MGKHLKPFFVVFFVLILTFNCFASDAEMEDFLSGAPDDFTCSDDISETISFKNIFKLLLDTVSGQLKNCTSLFVSLSIIVIMFSLLGGLNFGDKKELKDIAAGVISISLAAICFDTLSSNIEVIKNAVESMKIFSASAVPVITTLCISSGESFSSVVFSTAVSLCSSVFEYLTEYALLPLTVVFLTIGAAGCLTDGYNVISVCDIIKKIIKWAISIFIGVFTLALSLQNFLSKSSDSLTKKSIKMAVGSFIPVVGSALSGSVDNLFTLAASSKTSFAILGIIIITVIFLPPIIGNLCYGAVVCIVKSAAGFMKIGKLEKMLSVIADVFFILTGVCSACVYMMMVSFLLICINIG